MRRESSRCALYDTLRNDIRIVLIEKRMYMTEDNQ